MFRYETKRNETGDSTSKLGKMNRRNKGEITDTFDNVKSCPEQKTFLSEVNNRNHKLCSTLLTYVSDVLLFSIEV